MQLALCGSGGGCGCIFMWCGSGCMCVAVVVYTYVVVVAVRGGIVPYMRGSGTTVRIKIMCMMWFIMNKHTS